MNDGGRGQEEAPPGAVRTDVPFEALADSIGDGFVAVDESGTVVYADEQLAELTGHDRQRLVGRPLTAIMPERFHAAHQAGFDRYLDTGDRTIDWERVELAVENADGEEVPVEVSFGEFERGGERYFTGTVRDVSERHARERTLASTERAFDALFEHPSSFAALLDGAGRVRRANDVALAFVDADAAAVEGEPFAETPWWDEGSMREPDADVGTLVERATAGERQSFEAVHRSPDGERVVVDGIMEPVTDEDGEVRQVLVTGRDITDQVEATERLRDQQRALRELHEAIADPAGDRDRVVRRLLAVGCDYLGLPYGFFTDIDGETQRVSVATGDHPALQPGETAPLSESYCRLTVEADELVSVADARAELGGDDPAVERFDLGCYLGGKVLADGELHGTLCFAGDAAREPAFSEEERTFVGLLVDWLGRELERQRYREELEAARERLERTLERIEDGFFAVDDDWAVTYANETGAEILRQASGTDAPVEELLGQHLWDAVPDALGTQFHEHYTEAMRTQEPVRFEAEYEPLGVWFEVRAYPSPDGLSVFFHDVTERRRREQRLTGLVRTAREMTAADTPEAVAELVAEATADLVGQPMNAVRLYDEETDALAVAAVENRTDHDVDERPTYEVGEYPVGEAFERGERVVVEADRDVGPIESAAYLPIGDHGVLTLAAAEPNGIGDDQLRAAELLVETAAAAIARAERETTLRQYEAIVENARGMVYVVDADGRVTMATEPFATALGYDRDALAGTEVAALFDDAAVADHRTATAMLSSGYADRESFEAVCRTAEGDTFPVEVELTRLPTGDDEGFVGVVTDISALQRTRDELATQSDRFEYLFENIPDPVNEVEFVDGEPVVRSVNAAFEETFGYDAETVRGESLDDLIVPEDARETADEIDRRAREEGVVTREVRRRTADGLRTFLFRGIGYRVDDAEFGFGIYTDITEQRERQRRLQVLHTVLRHNLRTEMTIMRGYADQLAERIDGDPPEALAGLLDSIESVGELSTEVRNVERAVGRGTEQGADVGPTDVVPLVESVCRRAAAAHPAATVETSLPDAARATADDRLDPAIRGLIDNAVEHSDRDEPRVAVTVAADDRWVEVRVADDGPGIPEYERELVAGDRDITQLEHGSGLGLWLASWLASAYGGELSFEDNDPRGQVVVLRLPAEA